MQRIKCIILKVMNVIVTFFLLRFLPLFKQSYQSSRHFPWQNIFKQHLYRACMSFLYPPKQNIFFKIVACQSGYEWHKELSVTSVDSHKEHANYVYKVVRSLSDKFCERQLLLKNCPGMIRKLCKLRNLAEICTRTWFFWDQAL